MSHHQQSALLSADPILKKIILQLPKPEIHSTNDVFHDIMSCIVEQQIHYRSKKRIFVKALERSNIQRLTLDNFDEFEEYGLSQIKLKQGKFEAILAFIEYWSQNKLDFNSLTDDEIISELSAIKGIGKWTIDMILLYTLRRTDVFPFDDFHLKQIMTQLYDLNPSKKLKAQMIEVANKWEEQRSLAVLYLLDWKKFVQ